MPLVSYRDLVVWQRSIDLVEIVYKLSRKFPADERFALRGQIQRAAISVPSNVAEGYGRNHRGDYVQHLSIARGSLAELETQLIIAVRLGYLTKAEISDCWQVAQEVGRLLNRLMASLNKLNAMPVGPRTLGPRNAVRRNIEPRTLNPEP